MAATSSNLVLPTLNFSIEEVFRRKQETIQHNVLYLQRQVHSLNRRIHHVDIELEQSRNERLSATVERSRWTLVANRQEMLFLNGQIINNAPMDEVLNQSNERSIEIMNNVIINDDNRNNDAVSESSFEWLPESNDVEISNTMMMTVDAADIEEYIRQHARESRERASARKMLLHRRLAEVHHQLAEAHRDIASVIQQRVETLRSLANNEPLKDEQLVPQIQHISSYEQMNADVADLRNALDELDRKLDL
ncbi:hypothetical protein BDF19DRAFT_411681 [Syncephalis fuscata]|nr:hypothetical protein BDF19DRAFT_411681 [Syncephalis fuscata]